ncbi:MAG: trigger factor [Anaerolineae bacterium]|nr:trigger factor [Anaerolineae bacterium]
MKIKKKLLDDHQMELTVDVEAEQMETSKRRAARKLAKKGKIPGFRPGKAPYDVIVRHYGEAAIVEEGIDILVDEIYPKILEQAEIKPAAAGSLEKVEELDPPKLVFRVPLAPEIDLGNYQSIRVPYKYSAPGKKELNAALEDLRKMYATTKTVERAAEFGDYVLVDVKGKRAEPKENEDGQTALSREGYALVVRKEPKDDEWPYAGFSKELIGLSADDPKTISHKFPKDDPDESLQGKSVKFDVTMKTVRSMKLPDLDDKLAVLAGQYKTLDELKEALQKDLEAKAEAEYDDEYYVKLIDKIKAGATIKYPPHVIEHEAEHVLNDLRDRLVQQDLDLETYFKMRETTQEKFIEEEAKPVAIKRLERSLILDQIALDEKIEVDEGSLETEFGQTLTEMQHQGLDLSKVRGGQRGQKQVAEAIAMQSANRLMTRTVLERMKAIATGEAKGAKADKKPEKASATKKSGKSAGKKSPATKTAKGKSKADDKQTVIKKTKAK